MGFELGWFILAFKHMDFMNQKRAQPRPKRGMAQSGEPRAGIREPKMQAHPKRDRARHVGGRSHNGPDLRGHLGLRQYRPHRHLGDEQVFVLEGSVSDDTGTCTAGNYVRRPPGCVHTVRSDDGALVLAILSGGTQPLPAESPPRG